MGQANLTLWKIFRRVAKRGRLALLRKPLVAAEAEKRMKAGKANPPQNSAEGGETRDILSAAAGVSHDTIHKIETVEKDAPEPIRQEVGALQRALLELCKKQPICFTFQTLCVTLEDSKQNRFSISNLQLDKKCPRLVVRGSTREMI